MLQKILLVSGLSAVLLLSFAGARAAGPECPPHESAGCGGPGEMFRMADTDGDGAVTRAEFDAMTRAHIEQLFDQVDANHDGTVTREEADAGHANVMAVMHGQMHGHAQGRMAGAMAERWKQADKDHNGTLSAEEAETLPMLAGHFAAMDTDKNGQLTRAEIQRWHRQQH